MCIVVHSIIYFFHVLDQQEIKLNLASPYPDA